MNKHLFPLMFTTAIGYFCVGCSHTSISSFSQTSETIENNQSKDIEQLKTANFKWLLYADPKADANLAIEKLDFTLLAFAGRATTFPGISGVSSTLQEQCGYRLLANSSDALRSENELSLRKKLYQYAETYNQLVAAACQKHNLKGHN